MSEFPDTTDVAPVPPAPEDLPPPLPPAYTAPPRPCPTLPQLPFAQLGLLLVAAILGNIALRVEVAAAASTLAVLVVAKLLLDIVDTPQRSTFGLVVTAVVFAAWLPVRASTWLTSLNAAAVVFFLATAAVTFRPFPVRLATSTVAKVFSRLWLAWGFLRVLAGAVKPLRSARSARVVPIVRGLAIAFIPVVVLAALLASADAVFAQSITTDFDPSNLLGHVVLTGFVAAAIAGLVAVTGKPVTDTFEEHRPLGATEALILLGSVGTLYAGFALVQLLSAYGQVDAILQEQGLTYAEYARSGFFQLLWVAALTLVLLGLVRLLVANGSGRLDMMVRATGALVALLTILIVAVAVQRLGLYTDAFGQTTLRWYCTAFAWMLGVAFVAIAIAHWPTAQHQLPGVLLGLVVVTLFAVNVLNPEARVADHNLNRPDAAESLDANYLSRLSADAWPTILDHQELMASRLSYASDLQDRCRRADTDHGYGSLGFNLSKALLDCPSANRQWREPSE